MLEEWGVVISSHGCWSVNDNLPSGFFNEIMKLFFADTDYSHIFSVHV